MISYFLATIFAGLIILIAAFISIFIKYQGGAKPKDAQQRKALFWVLSIINPILFFLIGWLLLAPSQSDDQIVYDDYMAVLQVATVVGFVLYILIGFIISKMFRNGKLGNWF